MTDNTEMIVLCCNCMRQKINGEFVEIENLPHPVYVSWGICAACVKALYSEEQAARILTRVRSQEAHVDVWAVEKIVNAAGALAELRKNLGSTTSKNNVIRAEVAKINETLFLAFENISKLSMWMIGCPEFYRDEATREAFLGGPERMMDYIERIIIPVPSETVRGLNA